MNERLVREALEAAKSYLEGNYDAKVTWTRAYVLLQQIIIALDELDEPKRCAVCGMSGHETYLALCEGCGELTCGRCMFYQVDHEDAYTHELEDHLRYEECHGRPDIEVEGLGFKPEFVFVRREDNEASGSYVGSEPLYTEDVYPIITVVDEKEGFCCETHEALYRIHRALMRVGQDVVDECKALTETHFDEQLGDCLNDLKEEGELLTCEVCGGGGLTREDDLCYGCGHIVCVSCIQRSDTCGAYHTLNDHDLHFMAD